MGDVGRHIEGYRIAIEICGKLEDFSQALRVNRKLMLADAMLESHGIGTNDDIIPKEIALCGRLLEQAITMYRDLETF